MASEKRPAAPSAAADPAAGVAGRRIEIVVVPYDVEHDDTSLARSPRELLEAGFAERLEKLGHRVSVSQVWAREKGDKLAVVSSVALMTARQVARARSRNRFPLVLSGGCLAAVGVVSGLQRPGRRISILWIDAHGDFNTPESTPSGYWDGMSLAAVCGRSLEPIYRRVELQPVSYQSIAHLGGRSLDPPEIEDFERLNVLVVPPGPKQLDRALPELEKRLGRSRELYFHIDVDGIDPRDLPGIHLPEPKGVRLKDLVRCFGHLPPPTGMTLSGLNLERIDEARLKKTLDACVRLVRAALRAEAGTAAAPPG